MSPVWTPFKEPRFFDNWICSWGSTWKRPPRLPCKTSFVSYLHMFCWGPGLVSAERLQENILLELCGVQHKLHIELFVLKHFGQRAFVAQRNIQCSSPCLAIEGFLQIKLYIGILYFSLNIIPLRGIRVIVKARRSWLWLKAQPLTKLRTEWHE